MMPEHNGAAVVDRACMATEPPRLLVDMLRFLTVTADLDGCCTASGCEPTAVQICFEDSPVMLRCYRLKNSTALLIAYYGNILILV